MDDATMADRVAVAIKEGDGEIVVVAPVLLGFLEGRLASARSTTKPAVPSVMASPAISKPSFFRPRTRKRRKKMVISSQVSARS